MRYISINDDRHPVSGDCIFNLGVFQSFELDKFSLVLQDNTGFDVSLSYSFDGKNWCLPVPILEFEESLLVIDMESAYIPSNIGFRLHFVRTPDKKTYDGFDVTSNIDDTEKSVYVAELNYDGQPIRFTVDYISDVINKSPRWNFYDNQDVTVKRLLDQCTAISHSYGHTCFYFKTDVTQVNETLSVNVKRDVVAIKKLLIQFPNNEIPQDRNIVSEWDYPLQDEFISHIVPHNFHRCFGDGTVPVSKDYLYLPIVNKLFKVSSNQPGKTIMGKIAWWETYLSKWEDDETIELSEELRNSLANSDDFNIIEHLDEYLEDTVIGPEDILEDTIEEKKEATQNFTNKLNDSTTYIDLKETEAAREFYNKRLTVVSVNPDTNAFPVTMYDCTTIDRRVVALTYNLKNSVAVNRFSLVPKEKIRMSFNFVLEKKFSGEIMDLDNILTIENNRNKLTVINHKLQCTQEIKFPFELNEFYNLEIEYSYNIKQLAIRVYNVLNTIKNKVFEDISLMRPQFNVSTEEHSFQTLSLFGGNYYIGDLSLFFDDNKIMSDYVNPVLILNKFGT